MGVEMSQGKGSTSTIFLLRQALLAWVARPKKTRRATRAFSPTPPGPRFDKDKYEPRWAGIKGFAFPDPLCSGERCDMDPQKPIIAAKSRWRSVEAVTRALLRDTNKTEARDLGLPKGTCYEEKEVLSVSVLLKQDFVLETWFCGGVSTLQARKPRSVRRRLDNNRFEQVRSVFLSSSPRR